MKTLRKHWQNFCAWRRVNAGKELKEMPRGYLVVQFFFASFIIAMLPTILVPATKWYIEVQPVP